MHNDQFTAALELDSLPKNPLSPPQTNYVLGFLFRSVYPNQDIISDDACVWLIRKRRPRWQNGLLNGIGGRIEQKETPLRAMAREFQEETGVSLNFWQKFAILYNDNSVVHVFRAFDPVSSLFPRSTTDEEIIPLRIEDLPNSSDLIVNLHWLIPMALRSQGIQTIIEPLVGGLDKIHFSIYSKIHDYPKLADRL